MKIAVFSDIHSNPHALMWVLEDAKKHGCERFICLGDVVGYGYNPNTCIDICKNENVECILGNHDAGLIGKLSLGWFSATAYKGIVRQQDEVDESRKEWLQGLQYQKKEDFGAWRCCFSHGTFNRPEEFEYIHGLYDARLEFEFMKMRGCDVLFVGHTHYAQVFAEGIMDDIPVCYDIDDAPDLTINLNNYTRAIVNVGSIGYPRNQPFVIYVIFDTEEQRIHYRQSPFDFVSYIEEMNKRNIEIPL